MATQESCATLDTTILVLHPSSAPHVVNTDGALEFEEEGALVLPAQKQLKDALIRALNEYASSRKTGAVAVESWLRVDSRSDIEFPATYVIKLVGSGVTSVDVEAFSAAARLILAKLIPQQALGEPEVDSLLGKQDQDVLQSLGEDVAARFANKSIKQGVMIKFGRADSHGITMQGVMPALTVEQGSLGTIEGIERPLGFDEEKSIVILTVRKAANDDKGSHCEGRIEVLCHDLKFLRIVAQVYANCGQVEFKAITQPEARKKKPVITLVELNEVAANELDQFELE